MTDGSRQETENLESRTGWLRRLSKMERAIRYIWAIALLCAMPAYFGCVQKSAKLQQSVAPPDRTLFELGENYLQRGQYLRARMAFQNLMNTYPDSDMISEAYFATGDTFYEEGGTENFLQAENQYKDFIIFFPGDPKAPDAQLKIVALNYRMMNTPDRDQQYAYRTLQEIETFERRYPGSVFLPIIRNIKIGVEDNLARGNLGIADFYLNQRKNASAAMRRLEYIVENYKNFEDMDTVIYRIAGLYDGIQSPDPDLAAAAKAVAADWYSNIAEAYPFSRYYDAAKRRLTELGYDVPEVNTVLADANQAKIRPGEGFSPLKPLIDFGKALGFIAPPDLYETAQKTIAEEKAQAASKAAAGTGTGTGDDIQIELELRQSASGAPTGETPASSAGSEISGDSPDILPDSVPASDDGVNPTGGPSQQSKPGGRYQRKP